MSAACTGLIGVVHGSNNTAIVCLSAVIRPLDAARRRPRGSGEPEVAAGGPVSIRSRRRPRTRYGLGRGGRAVTGLPASAFTLLERWPEADRIEAFSNSPVPLSIVVALDSSGSMLGARFERASAAVLSLTNGSARSTRSTSTAFTTTSFASATGLAIARVRGWTGGRTSCGVHGHVPGGHGLDRTAAPTRPSSSPGRPADLGRQRSTGHRRRNAGAFCYSQLVRAFPAATAIKRSEAVVYAVGINARGQGAAPDLDVGALRRLTDPSGGMTQVVRSDDAVASAVARIADELSYQYLIGFKPGRGLDGKVHRLEVG